MIEQQEVKKKRRCKKCGSSFIYIRIKDNSLVCRSCGHIEKLENLDEGEENA